ncbi:DUF5683 domain-containing protein [Myroides pelagicus]|uniref:DUF5683 domain-containing protein n=1 Tax=Myroides pelagicus TaxID=270914 RepID=A0A7K1GK80_9FLAO|nr:DUF5683 domain-containing protein [Myroides pelagicus]MEC4114743.1 DUF5683 domain-containing protein [Myroides pelagicus]MTH29295.1 hypothetical protein [Myroides pelagicus]
MRTKILFFIFLFSCIGPYANAQKKEKESKTTFDTEADYKPLDPLAPARSAFFTSVVPGLGQIYNKSYWKVPLVYAGIGIPAYFWADNQRQYTRYRDEYKRRLQGVHDKDHPTFGGLDNARLLEAQKFYRRNRDLSVVITVGFYILSIVDANVDAHLTQFNVNENLSIRPAFEFNNQYLTQNQLQLQYAVNIQYKF